MSLRQKLLTLGAVAIVALIIAVLTGLVGIREGVSGVKELGRKRLPAVIAIQGLREVQVALKSSTYEAALWESDPDAQDQFEAIARDKQALWANVEGVWKRYEAIPRSAEEEALWQAFVAEWTAWKKVDQDIIELIRALAANHDAARQKELFQKYYLLGGAQRKPYLAAEKNLMQLVDINARNVASQTESAEQATELAQQGMLAVGTGATLAVLVLGALVAISILRQMGGEPAYAAEIARRISEGQLGVDVQIGRDDRSSLLFAIKTMRDRLAGILREIEECSRHMGQSAYQISKISNEISGVSRQQGSRSDEVSGAMLQLHQISAEVRSQASQAAERASVVEVLSRDGLASVRQNISSMQQTTAQVSRAAGEILELEESARQIHSIVNTIKDIAAQTNLLALNAAIEAARAGEQGRGFAVVADEVRKLAERTTASASEVGLIIDQLSTKVQQVSGTMNEVVQQVDLTQDEAHKTSGSIEGMASNAVDSAQAIQGIASSSHQQLDRFSLLESTTETLFSTLRESATKVDTTAAIGEDLRDVTSRLTDIMAGFSFASGTRILPVENEQRRAPRARHGLLVKVEQGGVRQEGVCADFSVGGLCLSLSQAVDSQQPVNLGLFVPDDDLERYASQAPVRLTGRIVRSGRDGAKHEYGIEFTGVGEAERSTIRRCFEFFKKNASF
ncbi:MAG: MCP four helix bundle domain-containing protein [Proteobacteria bacterium]|nr:MCP four helix bundle domain-containing protein [Pseudomonadota bacterium]